MPNLKEVIEQRRSVRAFRTVPIPQETLNEILRLGAQAPSSYNLQPWRFVVVTDPAQKEKLKEFGFDQEKLVQASAVLICCGLRDVFERSYIKSVIDLGRETGGVNDKRARFMLMAIPPFFMFRPCFKNIEAWINRQVMIAVGYLTLAAKSLGVDSCPIEGFVSKPLKEYFQIPDDVEVCCLLALGYADEPMAKYGGRFGLDQLCYSESYGQPFKPQETHYSELKGELSQTDFNKAYTEVV